ncbi:hypothetical protein IFM51744_04229 [Aspergillus udagawae]|uniref:Nuclear pore assembly and biogenesis-domain-containing protein n=1 Tax=Aspergillus udagawae TaxID=91492 RepID=A0ABQ1AM74_9EURO|nr:hypothetical protein IFM51744_04229 [Aspergillus udagawae]GFF84487.1 hypothetical protein IFM53868_04162 [Aspergillus udagawae]GFG17128.1 hypothetical protein IFM5058_08312 [Aspergillus udagawae]
MEYYLPDYLTPLLTNPTLQHLRSHATNWSSSFSSIRTTYLEPYLITPLSRLLASSTPDLVSVLLLLFVLVVSLKVLDYARRVVMFWVMLVVRVVFWGMLVALGCYVYSVGLEKAGRDLGWVLGVLWGFGEEVLAGVESGRAPAGGPGAGGYGYRREAPRGYGARGRKGR